MKVLCCMLIYIIKMKKNLEQFLLKKLPVVFAGGGLVFNAKKEILFIRRNGKWDLPKGKVEKDETYQAAALRETKKKLESKT